MADQRETVSHEGAQRLAAGLEHLLSTLASGAAVTFREARPAGRLAGLPGPLVTLTCRLSRGATGQAALVLSGSAGLTLARLFLGEEVAGKAETPGAEEEDAFRELANQVAGMVATALGTLLGTSVSFEAPGAEWLPGGRSLPTWSDAVALALEITAGSVATEGFLVVPRTVLRPTPAPALEANLPPLPESPPRKNGNGMEMLLDISLPVRVELGRTRMMIRDVLHLAPGSILELDKLAGEPVDILINDRSIARGEVVVVDENFGVRLTSIVTPSERVMNLR